jgi:hypothetical protein
MLATTVALALVGTLLLRDVSRIAVGRIDEESRDRFGDAAALLPTSGPESEPASGHMVGGGGWVTADDLRRIQEILRTEKVMIRAVIECDAVVAGDQVAYVRLLSVAGTEANAGNSSRANIGNRLLIAHRSTMGAGEDVTRFVDVSGPGVSWYFAPDDPTTVRTSHDRLVEALVGSGIAPPGTVGTQVRIASGAQRSSSEIAFNAGELLAAEFPGIRVLSRPEMAGRSQGISAVNIPMLLVFALLLPTVSAVVGIALVTAEGRSDQMTLLSTLGFGMRMRRALMTREMLMASTAGSVAGLLIYLVVVVLAPQLGLVWSGLPLRFVLSCLIPPTTVFLIMRRPRPGDLHSGLAELRR